MKVKELIKHLVELDEELEIIISRDEDGTKYYGLLSIEPHPLGACIYPIEQGEIK